MLANINEFYYFKKDNYRKEVNTMKKLAIVFVAVAVALTMMVGVASAKLIGVEPLLGYPDILFNNTGTITYDADTDKFVLDADDQKIAYRDGTVEYLSGPGFTTDMKIRIDVDSSGNMISCDMQEKVVEGTVTIGGTTYGVGTMLLSGDVSHFGWGESGAELGEFDFLIDADTLAGVLVTAGIWPTTVDTGIFAHAELLNGWTGSWECDFNLDKVKGDKAPVPEPATMLLLGSGLIGLAGLRKKIKKS